MLLDILKGLLIGICASAPLGPIAIFVLQKSLSEGHKSGFITGLGATLVDTIFGIIAIFALAIAQQFIDNNSILILIGGGVIVGIMGFTMVFKDPFRKMKEEKGLSSGDRYGNIQSGSHICNICIIYFFQYKCRGPRFLYSSADIIS